MTRDFRLTTALMSMILSACGTAIPVPTTSQSASPAQSTTRPTSTPAPPSTPPATASATIALRDPNGWQLSEVDANYGDVFFAGRRDGGLRLVTTVGGPTGIWTWLLSDPANPTLVKPGEALEARFAVTDDGLLEVVYWDNDTHDGPLFMREIR